jgi:hypothetical protein
VAYAKTTSIPCPITVQKSCYQNFAGCRCTGGGYWFSIQLTYEWSATINLVCRISCCFWPLTRSGKDSQMIQQWQNRYPNVFRLHGLFRLLNTSPRAVCVTWLCSSFSIIERVRYYHCAQYGRRTYGANMPHRQSLYHVTSWYSCAGVAPPSITFIGGKLYSEATITAFANKFQQITLISSSSIRLCLQSESWL